MAVLDLKKGWDAYDQAARKADNPRHKAILETMKEHYKWEVLGRPDKVLETVAEEGVYKFWGLGSYVELGNFEEIRGFYQSMVDDGTNVLQLDLDHLAVADWGLAAHGTWHQAFPGSKVPVVEVDDPEASYLVSARLAWFFPFTDGAYPKLISELVYFDPMPTAVRKLDPSERLYDELSEDLFR